MKHIYLIYQALFNRKDKIVHKSEIISIIEEYNKNFNVSLSKNDALKYLSRHKYIKRIFQSYYYINSLDERNGNFCTYQDKELLFIVLDKLNINWYVGLSSALYLSGKNWQVPTMLHIVNNKFSVERKILSMKVRFFKINDKMIFGLEKGYTSNKNVQYIYSNIAKTYLDMVYLKNTKKLIRKKNTKKYLKHYPKWLSKR